MTALPLEAKVAHIGNSTAALSARQAPPAERFHGTICYEPHPLAERDLQSMHRIDGPDPECSSAGSRMLRDLLDQETSICDELASNSTPTFVSSNQV